VDTLTHALSGALAARLLVAGDPRRPPAALPAWQAMAAGAVAAAFPDLDFVLAYVSELTYLRGHRGVTHSLLLWPAWGLLLAWLLAALSRRTGRGGAHWREFYAIACAGLLIHIAGDLITQFGTMILAPLSDRRFGLGTTFIIDLAVSGLLLAGLAASAWWRTSRVPAALALAAVAGWVGLGWVARGEALAAGQAYAARQGIAAPLVDAAPRPASPFNWTVIVIDGERYHYAHINTRRRVPLAASEADGFIGRLSAPYLPVHQAQWQVRGRFGDDGTEALARAVWQAEDFAFFRWFAMFPVLDHAERGATAASGCAGFRDLRFETPGRDALPFRFGLCASTQAGGGWRLYEMEATGRRWIGRD
jgi:inner membrane protein